MFKKMKILGALIFLAVFIQSYLNLLPRNNPVLTIIMIIGLFICAVGFYGERKRDSNNIIITNAKIYTMDSKNTVAEAIYIKDGLINAIGSESDILRLKKGGEQNIDARGRTIIPGLIDSHMHLLGYGQYITSLILSDVKSIDEIIKKAKKYINKNNLTKDDWLLGYNLNDEQLAEKRMPTRKELDNISSEIPIVIKRVCYHSISCNSKALEIAGVDENTTIDGGNIEKDADGQPNGILREAAKGLVEKYISKPTVGDVKIMLEKASQSAVENGLTGIQTDDFIHIEGENFWEKVIEAYNELAEEKRLPVRIYEQCLFQDENELKEFISKGYKTGIGNKMFKIGPLKILSDGSLGSRTAYLSEPYNDDPDNYGTPILEPEKIENLIKIAHDNDMHTAIHAIGDKAIQIAVEGIKKAQSENKKNDIRHGIVHYQITNEKLFKEVKDNNIITYIQPIFVGYDSKIAESRIGNERAETSYKWKTLFDMGITAALGTDCPVESLNPFENIYCAVNRQDLDGKPEGGWFPDQKITVKEAVKGYTINSAYASYDENNKGTIEVDKYADMIMISEDIFEIDPQNIKDIKCQMTIVDGKIVYKR